MGVPSVVVNNVRGVFVSHLQSVKRVFLTSRFGNILKETTGAS